MTVIRTHSVGSLGVIGLALLGFRPRPRCDEASDDDDDDPRAAAQRAAARRRRETLRYPTNQAVVKAGLAGETGLALTWVHCRGPGGVTFDPMSMSVEGGRGGEVVTTVWPTVATGSTVCRGSCVAVQQCLGR